MPFRHSSIKKISPSPLLGSSQSGFVHVLLIIIILIGLGVGVYLVQQKTNIFSKASSADIDQLTSQLEALSSPSGDRSAQSEGEVGKMLALASERKEKLLEELTSDPEAFLRDARLADKRSQFPETVKPYIEQQAQAQGVVSLTYQEKFDHNRSVLIYSLLDNDKKVTATIHGVKDVSITSGDSVSVSGIGIGGNIAIRSASDLQVLPSSDGRSAQGTNGYNSTGDEKVLVIPVNFTSKPTRPFTQSTLKDRMEKIASFFRTSSYGQLRPQFEVTDWVTIDGDPTGCGWNTTEEKVNDKDDANDWARLIQIKASAQGIPVSQHKRFIYIFDRPEGCFRENIGGYGALIPFSYGGKTSFRIVPSEALVFIPDWPTFIIHEFGHNLGLGHASFLDCHGKAIDTFDSCSWDEYGDKYSVMSNVAVMEASEVPDFNAPAKLILGWIDPAQARSISSSGIYKITSLEQKSNDLKTIIINKPDKPNQKYYLSYRQPLISTNSLLPITKGVSIHVWSEEGKTGSYGEKNQSYFNKSWLITSSPASPTLTDGSSFTDPINNITIKQISHDDTSVSVKVNFGQDTSPSTSSSPLNAYQVLLDTNGQTAYSRRCPIADSINQSVGWDLCTNWLADSAEEITGVKGARYTSIDSYVTSQAGDEYLNLIFMEDNGQNGSTIRCKVTNVTGSGLSGQNCEPSKPISYSNLRGVGQEKYSAIASYTLNKNNQLTYQQSLVDQSGQVGYARSCPIQNGTVDFSSCSGWQTVSFTNLRGLGNERYYSVTNFILTTSNGGNLQQSLLDFNGSDGYYRNCPVTTAGITWESCTGWSLVPFGSLRGGSNEKYKSITTYIIHTK